MANHAGEAFRIGVLDHVFFVTTPGFVILLWTIWLYKLALHHRDGLFSVVPVFRVPMTTLPTPNFSTLVSSRGKHGKVRAWTCTTQRVSGDNTAKLEAMSRLEVVTHMFASIEPADDGAMHYQVYLRVANPVKKIELVKEMPDFQFVPAQKTIRYAYDYICDAAAWERRKGDPDWHAKTHGDVFIKKGEPADVGAPQGQLGVAVMGLIDGVHVGELVRHQPHLFFHSGSKIARFATFCTARKRLLEDGASNDDLAELMTSTYDEDYKRQRLADR